MAKKAVIVKVKPAAPLKPPLKPKPAVPAKPKRSLRQIMKGTGQA